MLPNELLTNFPFVASTVFDEEMILHACLKRVGASAEGAAVGITIGLNKGLPKQWGSRAEASGRSLNLGHRHSKLLVGYGESTERKYIV